jgi:hypothetical protein
MKPMDTLTMGNHIDGSPNGIIEAGQLKTIGRWVKLEESRWAKAGKSSANE